MFQELMYQFKDTLIKLFQINEYGTYLSLSFQSAITLAVMILIIAFYKNRKSAKEKSSVKGTIDENHKKQPEEIESIDGLVFRTIASGGLIPNEIKGKKTDKGYSGEDMIDDMIQLLKDKSEIHSDLENQEKPAGHGFHSSLFTSYKATYDHGRVSIKLGGYGYLETTMSGLASLSGRDLAEYLYRYGYLTERD